jgi:hypothetical protein
VDPLLPFVEVLSVPLVQDIRHLIGLLRGESVYTHQNPLESKRNDAICFPLERNWTHCFIDKAKD